MTNQSIIKVQELSRSQGKMAGKKEVQFQLSKKENFIPNIPQKGDLERDHFRILSFHNLKCLSFHNFNVYLRHGFYIRLRSSRP